MALKKLIDKIGHGLFFLATWAIALSLFALLFVMLAGYTVLETVRGRNALERKEE